jgi:hypothetical protein
VPRTPPSICSATRKCYLLSARSDSISCKCSAADSKQRILSCSAMLFLPDGMKWDLTLSTCEQTWCRFEHVISNLGRCFSIPLSRSPFCTPEMVWTKCCIAAYRCSRTSLLSVNVGLQLMLSKCVALDNWLSSCPFHS